jgi:hypothetical protein
VGEQSLRAFVTIQLLSRVDTPPPSCSCACHPLHQKLLGVTSSSFKAPSLHAFLYLGRAIMPYLSVVHSAEESSTAHNKRTMDNIRNRYMIK